MQNNAWQRFQWWGYVLSENLTIGLNHKRLLIKFYLTHKRNAQCSPVAWIKDIPSVLRAVTLPALRSPMPFAHSKKKAHIEPSSLYCGGKLCCHLPHEQAYWWLRDLEPRWQKEQEACQRSHALRERNRTRRGQTACGHWRPLHRAVRTRLGGSWGAPCHVSAGNSETSNSYHMDEHAGGGTKRRALSGAASWLQSLKCPRGNSLLLSSAQPSVSVGNTSQPPRRLPSLPTGLSHIHVQQASSLPGCRGQG